MIKKLSKFLLSFLELQLFVSLVSWPLLLAWGLPASLATPIGNLVFNPFLSLFIFLSSICVGTEIFGIPNGVVIYALETLSTVWHWCISWGTPAFLMYVPRPPYWGIGILLVIPFAVIFLVRSRSLRMTIMTTTFVSVAAMVHAYSKHTTRIQVIPLKNKYALLITYHARSYLIAENMPHSNEKWVQYTLRPLLIQTTGAPSIDALILLNAQNTTGVTQLTSQLAVSKITDQAKHALRAYTIPLRADQMGLSPTKIQDA